MKVSNMLRSQIDFSLCPVCREEKHFTPYSNGQKICPKCKNELMVTKLRLLGAEDEIPDHCPFCGKEGEEDDTIYDKYDVVVFKCKKCGKLDGYKYNLEDDDWDYGFELSDTLYPRKTAKIAEKEGKPIISASGVKKITKEINKKAKNPQQKCQDQLTNLLKEKRKALKEANVDQEVLESAITQTRYSIQKMGAYTEKQLKILYPAAILATQETLIQKGNKTNKTTNDPHLDQLF